MVKYGLVGEKLTHSFSKIIHERFGKYEYSLMEIDKNDIDNFFDDKKFDAINITIPYKKTVIPHLHYIDENAKRIGAVNTVRNINGKLYGFNTDYYGLRYTIKKMDFDFTDKNILILGTGGTSNTATILSKNLGARSITRVSRNTNKTNIPDVIDYETMYNCAPNFDYIINTTPVGMFPKIFDNILDISKFENVNGIVDVIYNPMRTMLRVEANDKNIKAINGLYMLIVQAVVAYYYFTNDSENKIVNIIDTDIDNFINENEELIESIYKDIVEEKQNIVLIGMPGCGKSTYAKRLSNMKKMEMVDTDSLIEEKEHKTCKQIIENKGIEYFRKVETSVIKEVSKMNHTIIATGGGAILNPENVKSLKLNGKIIFLNRKLENLESTDTRPLSNNKQKLEALYNERYDKYVEACDVILNEEDYIV